MTDHDLEHRLRAWYQADIDDRERAPQQLRTDLATLARTAASSPRPFRAGLSLPSVNRFAPIALAATALVVALLVSIGLIFRSPNVGPPPVPGPSHEATPEPSGPLGGGLMLVHDAYDPSHPGPLEVFTLDAGTGRQTLLGAVQPLGGSSYSQNTFTFQWGADRKHVLITRNGQGPIRLDNQTKAGRELTVICCELPPEVPPRGYDWLLAPQSDLIAGLNYDSDSINILDVDSGALRTLPLRPGSLGCLGCLGCQGRFPISWAPDGSAVVISACSPCNSNRDDPHATPSAVQHAHLFIVPVDGSPVRELLDATETTFWSAAWSPDGTTIAFGSYECAADEHAPYCQHRTHQLMTMTVATSEDTVVAEVSGDRLVWSPDGRRITFADTSVFVVDADGSHLTKVADGWEPTWSPDGEWLVFSSTTIGPSIIPADGGEPRLLGPYSGWAW
jgi:hypothetical protein